ncbi:hypothetical protein TNCV_489491 [Trichonephila clavipes]|nr:hypothetical protein TNCV_489491 [Trichonephila clavipes]
MRSYLDAHSNGEMNNKMDDIEQFDAKKNNNTFKFEVTLHDMDLSEAPPSKYSKLSTDKSDSRSSRSK